MKISLKNIVPIPLKVKILATQKDVWNKEISFNKNEFTKIVAPQGTCIPYWGTEGRTARKTRPPLRRMRPTEFGV
jgi:hypothetical protein